MSGLLCKCLENEKANQIPASNEPQNNLDKEGNLHCHTLQLDFPENKQRSCHSSTLKTFLANFNKQHSVCDGNCRNYSQKEYTQCLKQSVKAEGFQTFVEGNLPSHLFKHSLRTEMEC